MDPTQNQNSQQITGYDPTTGAPIYGTPQGYQQPQITGYDPATGAPVYGTAQPGYQQPQQTGYGTVQPGYQQPQQTGFDPVTGAPVYGAARVPNEVEDNKLLLIFSYLVPIVTIIAVCMGIQKKGRYCAHHLGQALNIVIFWFGGGIVWGILSSIIIGALASSWNTLGAAAVFVAIRGLINTVIWTGGGVLAILGAVAAGNGNLNKVPLGNVFKFFPGA